MKVCLLSRVPTPTRGLGILCGVFVTTCLRPSLPFFPRLAALLRSSLCAVVGRRSRQYCRHAVPIAVRTIERPGVSVEKTLSDGNGVYDAKVRVVACELPYLWRTTLTYYLPPSTLTHKPRAQAVELHLAACPLERARRPHVYASIRNGITGEPARNPLVDPGPGALGRAVERLDLPLVVSGVGDRHLDRCGH
jgi:hypothetical protein